MDFNKNKTEPVVKIVIDAETAELEFERFCEEWEIDNDLSDLSEEDEKGYNKHKRNFIRAVMKGRLKFNNDGEFQYTVSHHSKLREGDVLKISMPGGRHYKIFDKYKAKETQAQEQALYGAITGKSGAYFADIMDIDTRVFRAIIILFLGV